MLSDNEDIGATIMTGFTPIHGLGNYVSINVANQEAYDEVVKSGLLDNFLPDVYTIPVFDLYKSAGITFVMNLANVDQYAQKVAETILVPQSSKLLDSCVASHGICKIFCSTNKQSATRWHNVLQVFVLFIEREFIVQNVWVVHVIYVLSRLMQ